MKEEKKINYRDLILSIVFALLIGLIQAWMIISLIHCIQKYQTTIISEQYSDYYVFAPNSYFADKSNEMYSVSSPEDIFCNISKVYFSYINNLKQENDIGVLVFETKIVFEGEDYVVITYSNPKEVELSWDEYRLPLKNGEWFYEDDQLLIICRGKYRPEDSLMFFDINGKTVNLPVVGEAKYRFLNSSVMMNSDNEINSWYCSPKYKNKTVYFLNPESKYNVDDEYIKTFNCFLILKDASLYYQISDYGDLHLVKSSLKDNILGKLMISFGIIILVNILMVIYTVIIRKKGMAGNRFVILLGNLIGALTIYRYYYIMNMSMLEMFLIGIQLFGEIVVLIGIKQKSQLHDVLIEEGKDEKINFSD